MAGFAENELIPQYGGYHNLLTYKLGLLIYDATVAFCERYINRRERTYDQMVQAARSGVANIVEGSEASATSKKTELKLTNVAKASQEELLFDYQAFLRQNRLSEWHADSPCALLVRQSRPRTLDQLRQLMAVLVSDKSDKSDMSDKSDIKAEVAGNVMICLIHQETFLLNRQIARLAAEFEEDGGFTERLYRVRSSRNRHSFNSTPSDLSDLSDLSDQSDNSRKNSGKQR